MRVAWIVRASALALPHLLGGCLASPGVAVASLAADGTSYAATGKSLADHGVSTVKDEDCATMRVFTGGAICRDPKHPVPAAPLEDRAAHAPAVAVATAPAPQPVMAPAEGVYFQIGTFSDRRRAELYARRYADYNPRLTPTIFAGRELMRVVLGPLDAQQMERLRLRGVAGFVVDRPGAEPPAVATSPALGAPG